MTEAFYLRLPGGAGIRFVIELERGGERGSNGCESGNKLSIIAELPEDSVGLLNDAREWKGAVLTDSIRRPNLVTRRPSRSTDWKPQLHFFSSKVRPTAFKQEGVSIWVWCSS